MKKYILPSVSILCILMGFIIGNAVSNKVNAQHFYIHNGQLMMAPSSKTDQMIQLLGQSYVDSLDVDSLTDIVLDDLVKQLDPHSSYMTAKETIEKLSMMPADAEIVFSVSGQEPIVPNVLFFDRKEQEAVFTNVSEQPVF